MAPRVDFRANGPDFIQRFTRRESKKKKRPVPLTADQRVRLREELKEVKFLKPAYADATKINIAGMLRKWKKYCEFNKFKETWKAMMEKADREMAMDFLHHICDTCNVNSDGTSWEYFRQYKQLYSSVTGHYMNTNDSKEVRKFHDDILIHLFGLRRPNADGKPVIGLDGQLAVLIHNLAYDTIIFPSERQRVDLWGIYLLMGYTGGRPAEFVDNEKKAPKDGSLEEVFGPTSAGDEDSDDKDPDDEEAPDEKSRLLEEMLSQAVRKRGRPKALCYEDILLAVVRHPETGRDVLVMAIKLIHHKGEDRKPRPTVYFLFTVDMLILCPITVIVSLALRDKAFDAPSLTSARRVFNVKNLGPVHCTPLRWKEEMLKVPVFRRTDDGPAPPTSDHTDTDTDTDTDTVDPFPYWALRDTLTQQTLDAGLEQALGPRSWRRWTANEVNGKAPDTVRDQVMRHDPRWTTFYGAYLNIAVELDIENTMLGKPTQDRLIKKLTHIGLTRDPRAKRDMVPDEIWRDMPPDPEIVELENRRAELKKGRFRIKGDDNEMEIRKLGTEIRTKRGKRDNAIIADYHKYHFYNRPTWDVERQARGDVEDDEYVAPVIDLSIPERAELAKNLCWQPQGLSEEEIFELRVHTVELNRALCGRRETARSRRIRTRPQAEVVIKQESPGPDDFPLLLQNTQCPDCIGDARLTVEERKFRYCRPNVRNDHWDDKHLEERERAEQRGEFQLCKHPKCLEEKFQNVDHFRSHVASVHKVPLRTSDEVTLRRARKARRW